MNMKHKRANGTGTLMKHGYMLLSKPKHPNAMKHGRLLEHIFVMTEHIGRPLVKGETVHHKNGIRSDNRIENLELWTTTHPSGVRYNDLLDWCKSFINNHNACQAALHEKDLQWQN